MGEIRRRHPEKIKQNSPNNSSKKGGNNRHFVVKVFIASFIVITFLFVYNRNFYSSQNEQLRKSDLPDALIEDIYNQTNWGTFRPQLYFGMKMKHPNSPLFGLLWYKQPHEEIIYDIPIRHWCEHGDNVRFSWLAHDGKSFGRQQIVDRSLEFEIDWIGTEQNSWTASFNGNSGNDSYAFVFYMTKQDASNILNPKNQMLDSNHFSFISGSSPEIGHYKIYIRSNNIAAGEISSIAYLIQPELDLSQINKLILYSLTRPHQSNGQLILYQNDRIPGPESDNANFVAVQFTIKGKFNLFVDFTANDAEPMLDFNSKFAIKLREFDEKFDQVFPIDSSNLISPDIKKYTKMAKTALSSLLGGIGAWHGFAFVKTPGNQLVQDYGPLSLFSAVPSRPFFPRGFLWDEGFHNLVIRQFNPELSLQILGSWLNTMNSEGWIPREIILGKEAEAKVPNEFLVQSTSVANPPVFFYVLEKFVRNSEQFKRHYSQIEKLYPRLKQFYIWLRTTQQGQGLHGTMQWQGRNRTTDRELNPKILPSGLDDFPRATHPSSEEFHLDLRCWIAFSSRILRQLAEIFGDSHWVPIIEEDVRLFNNIDVLNRLHWSEEKQRYSDFGLHSEKVNLVKVVAKTFDNHGSASQPEYIFVRKTMEKPKLRLVDDVFGYVNIFPLLLRLLPPNDPKLNILLHSLNKTEDLWTSYGLRSLSTRSPYYRSVARNTEHDPPYWRGAIWININYLALDALNYYTKSGGPYARLAGNIYEELRQNIMRNIAEQFDKTGFFWEHYDDKTGEGMGTRPFTGWTSLVLNIVAEKFD